MAAGCFAQLKRIEDSLPYKRGDLWWEWPYKRGTTTQINTKCVNNNFAYTLIQLLDKNKSEILCLYGVV